MYFTKKSIIVISFLFIASQSLQAASFGKIDINGYFSFEYEQCVTGDAGCDKNGSFDLDLFDLVLNFELSNKLRIATDLTWEHGPATEDNRGNVATEYAFAEYRFNNAVKFRAGKMFTHFGIYNEIHTAKPAILTVKEPIATNKNDKLGSDVRFYPRWNTGIALLGDLEIGESAADYIIQVSNGEDSKSNPYEENANTDKAVNARFRYQLNDNLNFGVSFYYDIENRYSATGIKDGMAKIKSYSGQVEYEDDTGLGIEFEYIAGKIDSYMNININRYAFSLMLYYRIKNTVTPYYRYEFLDPNTSINKNNGEIHIVGVNINVDENTYLKFELDRIQTELSNSKYSGNDFTEFKSSISIGF